jgi:hypothetical protein
MCFEKIAHLAVKESLDVDLALPPEAESVKAEADPDRLEALAAGQRQ